MISVKRMILAGVSLVAFVGVGIALSNLPVVTGCGFYGLCGAGDLE